MPVVDTTHKGNGGPVPCGAERSRRKRSVNNFHRNLLCPIPPRKPKVPIFDIEDWDFGLTRRDRTEKVAVEIVHRAFPAATFRAAGDGPAITFVGCIYDGHRTLGQGLDG